MNSTSYRFIIKNIWIFEFCDSVKFVLIHFTDFSLFQLMCAKNIHTMWIDEGTLDKICSANTEIYNRIKMRKLHFDHLHGHSTFSLSLWVCAYCIDKISPCGTTADFITSRELTIVCKIQFHPHMHVSYFRFYFSF